MVLSFEPERWISPPRKPLGNEPQLSDLRTTLAHAYRLLRQLQASQHRSKGQIELRWLASIKVEGQAATRAGINKALTSLDDVFIIAWPLRPLRTTIAAFSPALLGL